MSNLFKITTRNGDFIAVGEDENAAQINFSLEFPSEKIRNIEMLEEKAIEVSFIS